jgi:hypothetical protein
MAGSTHDHADATVATPDAVGRTGAPDRERTAPAGTTRPASGVHGQRSTPDPSPVDHAPRRDRLTRRRTLALQRTAGNRAVSGLLRHVQRVAVKEKRGETLYNAQNAAGKATSGSYGRGKFANYEMTRQGDSGVTVTVRISFVSQARQTTPKPAGAPATDPDIGDLVGAPTEIPADDARRAWATNVIEEGVKIWNGRLTFVGEEWNLTEDNTKKRLPVTFRAQPVFGLNDEYDNRIVVHPPAIVAGSPGHKIDAGNYYMNKGTYSGDEKVITAHEYGHLLGIDDEYSQSNEMLNAMLHDAAPGDAPSAGKALDKATVERMVLVSMKAPLLTQLDAAMPQLVGAIQAQRKLVKTRMASAARTAAVSADVRTQLRDQLAARADASVSPNIPQVVAFQTTTNFSNVTHAGAGVDAGFSAAALSTQVRDAYWDALTAASNRNVTLKGLGDVSIDVHGAVPATTASGGGNAAAATGLATSTVGAAPVPAGGAGGGGASPAGGGTPGLPAISPPATLIDKLAALPTTWSAAGSAVETGITPDRYTAKMVATLKAAQAVAAVASLVGIGDIGTTSALYREAYALVTNAAQTASRELATELIGTTMTPVLTTGVSDLESAIATEVGKVMGTPASGVAGLGTPDPNMVALVGAMKARLDADKAATAGGDRDPLGKTGGTAAPQDVTYDYQGLMGNNATTAMRPDQFDPMLRQFNKNLTTTFEKTFTAEVK